MASRWRNSDNIKPSFNTFLSEASEVAPGNPSGTGVVSPAERARQLGLQSNGKGGYIDPNSGEVVAQTVNGELVFYSQNRASGGAVSDSSGGAAAVSAQPSWADPITGMVTTPPGKPEGPEEQGSVPDPVPATAPHGYNSFITQTKQQMYDQHSQPAQAEMPDDMDMGGEMDMGNDMGMDMGGIGEDYLPDDLLKRTKGQAPPPSFKGMRDSLRTRMANAYDRMNPSQDSKPKVAPQQPQQQPQVSQEPQKPQIPDIDGDGDVDMNDLQALRERFIETHGLASKSENMRRKAMDKTWAPFEKIINDMEPGDKQQNFIRNMMKNMKFEDRLNSGAGIGELGRSDIQILNDRRKDMIDKYDFNDKDSVREFTSQFKDDNITDEYAETVFNAMPKSVRDQLTNKGNAAGSGPRSKLHYNGTDKDGNAIRGTSGGKSRAIQMMKLLLQSDFKDAYTGLPLDLNSWDLEHVMPASAAEDDDDFQFRESPENWVASAFNVNKAKGDMSMEEFFKGRVDNMVGRLDDDSYWDKKQSVYDFLNSGKSALEKRVSGLLGDADEEDGIKYPGEGAGLESLMEIRDSERSKNMAMKKEIRDMIKNGDLPKETAELANKIKNNPSIGKALMKMMGGTYMVSKGANNPNAKSRANSIHDDRYLGAMAGMFGGDRQQQKSIMKAYREALQTIKDTGTEDGFGKSMLDSGAVDPENLKKLGISKIFGLMQEGVEENMVEDEEDGIDIKEFLMKILPLLAKNKDKMSFESFKNKGDMI